MTVFKGQRMGDGRLPCRQRLLVWCAVTAVISALVILNAGCATAPIHQAQQRHDDLVATDLVGAMIQLSELDPITSTLQYSVPTTSFGRSLIAGLRQAGYGLQRVKIDHGSAYVSYAMRHAETNVGSVTDYLIQIGGIELRREYRMQSGKLFPSSLLFITGAKDTSQVIMNPELFTQQGGQLSFLSGVQSAQTSITGIREITQADSEPAGQGRQRTQGQHMTDIRSKHVLTALARGTRPANLSPVSPQSIKRLVLIQSAGSEPFLGLGNKRAIATLVDQSQQDDAFLLTACGSSVASLTHKDRFLIRVSEALLYAGVSREVISRAPCQQAGVSQGRHVTTVVIELQRVTA